MQTSKAEPLITPSGADFVGAIMLAPLDCQTAQMAAARRLTHMSPGNQNGDCGSTKIPRRLQPDSYLFRVPIKFKIANLKSKIKKACPALSVTSVRRFYSPAAIAGHLQRNIVKACQRHHKRRQITTTQREANA
jgi:hypothetical protein